MRTLNRRNLLKGSVAAACLMVPAVRAVGQTSSLSEIGKLFAPVPRAKIFTARDIVTLDPSQPSAEAIAVVGTRILAVGALSEVQEMLGDQPFDVDERFADKVIVPGFISQHDHPVLAALSMSSEILSIEEWALPTGTVPSVKDKADFMKRLTAAVEARTTPGEPVVTWGYHAAFYGPLTRADLDGISTERPILVWGRSCHEMILNSAALTAGGVTQAAVAAFDAASQKQTNLAEGHFWEQGLFAVLPNIASLVATPEQLRAGLELSRDFMHSKGITFGNEPGGILAKPVQDGVNAVFSSPDMPFRWSFMVDAKSMVASYTDDGEVIARSEALQSWYYGMTSLAPRQAKLFSDGAIYSQLMQVRAPYLDDHHGEWMMEKELFERAFRVYWDAGYQLHIHVNGDAGLDRVLETLETNMRRNPRFDHRTVIVHFAVSAFDQVERIKALGAIVSGNPYYVTALADQYSEVGLGAERADSMVRLGDLTRAGVRWSLHSDMPMAPADPLFLMWCAVNRVTTSGRVAAPEQAVSAEDALRGVTIEAAYSLQMEEEIGSLVRGKRANMTILAENPLEVDPMAIREVEVWGTVMEGRVLPVPSGDRAAATQQDASAGPLEAVPPNRAPAFDKAALEHALKVTHAHHL